MKSLSVLLAPFEGNPTHKQSVVQSFGVLFVASLNNQLISGGLKRHNDHMKSL